MNLWKVDPTYTNFVPKTAAEAVDRYVRCRNNGLKAMLIPECLIECARGLKEAELNKFEQWIINPSGDLSEVDLVEQPEIREANDAVFQENLARVTANMEKADLEVEPMEQDDEKAEAEALPAIPPMLPLVRQSRFRFTES
jgi:hypothetical protein